MLYRLGTEPEYREALLGAPSADWGLIARHLKKSPESAQRRFLELKIMPEADDRTESDVSIDIEGQPEMPAGPAGTSARRETTGTMTTAEQPLQPLQPLQMFQPPRAFQTSPRRRPTPRRRQRQRSSWVV